MNQPPRRFFLPMVGLTLLFAALGPAIGAALFVAIALALETPAAAQALGHFGSVAPPSARTIALIVAYVLGVGPAAATGFSMRCGTRRRRPARRARSPPR